MTGLFVFLILALPIAGYIFWISMDSETPSPQNDHWSTSENGNPIIISGNKRVTVFASNDGWKYCFAYITDEFEPYFSDIYTSKTEAKKEGLALLMREAETRKS